MNIFRRPAHLQAREDRENGDGHDSPQVDVIVDLSRLIERMDQLEQRHISMTRQLEALRELVRLTRRGK